MKVVIQIPCLNEEDNIATVIRSIPRQLTGVAFVEVLVIDDGSTDKSVMLAEEAGADRIVSLRRNQGLANAFLTGLETSIEMGADVIVNLDADGQYETADIQALLDPILENTADVTIGCRDMSSMEHFTGSKRTLQRLGSAGVRQLTGLKVQDATSGFRAIHRSAALEVVLYTTFTYTIETLILWSDAGFRVLSVPIRAYEVERPSRLFGSKRQYIWRTIRTIGQAYWVYRPQAIMGTLGALLMLPGLFFIGRFLYAYSQGNGDGNVQSLVLASLLIVVGIQFLIAGLIAHLISTNRLLLLRTDKRLHQARQE
jgi:glycosyltransferase involved in cell wall biosynthesis